MKQLGKGKSSNIPKLWISRRVLNSSKFMKWCVVAKGVRLSDPQEIMSPLNLHHFHSSGASKDMNIFILCELFAVHSLGNDYVGLPGLWCFHSLKQCQLSCSLCFFNNNFQRSVNKDLGQSMHSSSVLHCIWFEFWKNATISLTLSKHQLVAWESNTYMRQWWATTPFLQAVY